MMVDVVIKEIFKDIGNSIIYELKTIKNYLTPSWLWGGKPGTGQPVGPQQESEKHSSLVPPPRHMAINIPVTVQMDGRKMASTVMNQVVASATYPTSASGADGRGQWLGPSAYATEQGRNIAFAARNFFVACYRLVSFRVRQRLGLTP